MSIRGKRGTTEVVSGATLGFPESEWSWRERAKWRKVAFHVDRTGSVTEEAE